VIQDNEVLAMFGTEKNELRHKRITVKMMDLLDHVVDIVTVSEHTCQRPM